jgi:hypothetical protein
MLAAGRTYWTALVPHLTSLVECTDAKYPTLLLTTQLVKECDQQRTSDEPAGFEISLDKVMAVADCLFAFQLEADT